VPRDSRKEASTRPASSGGIETAARAEPARPLDGAAKSAPQPGAWLRLTALFASAAVLLAVVSGAASLGAAHRVLAALALPPLVAIVVAARLAHPRLFVPALSALVLFGIAALVTLPGLHLALAAAAFAATLIATVATYRGEPAPRAAWRDYVTLTKPRIMSLLLVTGLCAMFVGAEGAPALWLVAVTMTGLALACGGASALNHVLDRDIDKLMGTRTRARPLAAERMPPTRALEFGLALSAFSFVLLASVVNVLTATLALVGNLFYVLVYTRWLKRSTPQNIVIGGAAGAVPPLVGWAAVTGNLTLPALWLFLIVFFWTPPHFWALALLIRRDYEAARIPMLPVVRGVRETTRQIVIYALVLVAVTSVPFLWGTLGVAYLAAALVLGAAFVWLALRLRRDATARRAALLFHYSLLYLALLFVAMALDPLVG
jgi:heme o synthase